MYVRVLVEVVGWYGMVWFGLGWRAGDLHRLGCSGVVRKGGGGGGDCAGVVEEVLYCYCSVAIVFGASSLRLWIDGVI